MTLVPAMLTDERKSGDSFLIYRCTDIPMNGAPMRPLLAQWGGGEPMR